MTAPLDDAEYLVRSENRVAILELLAEGPRERRDVRDVIGASRATMARVFGELVDRGWIERRGHDYHITPFGRIVVEDLDAFLRTIGTAQRFRDIQQYFPVDGFGFDLRRLADADVLTPRRTNVVAPLKRSANLLVDADVVRILGSQFDDVHVQAAVTHLEAHPDSAEHHCIFLGESLETIVEDAEMADSFRRIQELTPTEYYRHPGDLPYVLSVFDERVVIELNDGSGFVPAILVTDDEEVLEWARTMFDRFREEAEPIGPDTFSPDG